jgi:protease-4
MGKFLLGVATGLALVFLTIVLLIFAALRFREKAPVIADNSVLVLRLEGEIPEKPPFDLPSFVGGDRSALTVAGVWTTLKKAAADAHIKAIVLEPENLGGGWAKLEEMRSDLEQFRK